MEPEPDATAPCRWMAGSGAPGRPAKADEDTADDADEPAPVGADGFDAASGSTGVRSSSEKLPCGPLKRSD